ncbi:hypothetical protein [Enterovibrio nigricans]|uniref:Uncharacterized protein n=1 Tax=Enterovibrio nigricans DSM 22720 TaxID=1121868 RepID=A0A1T4W661_9GAMM|nr:hypothetical protein [Enterovibrio nigricans]PKF48843.1 hypothetical protein AT251_23175 [Enterovibrio nigricans]SKA72784.1 hypothetical protein SAMN02745132_04785 [Enterovibrio nigricans DSM 22720]
MKSYFSEKDFTDRSDIFLRLIDRKSDKWGYHKITQDSHEVTIYTGSGPVSGDGVADIVFPLIKKSDKVLILTGSHGDCWGRTASEISDLKEDVFLMEDAISISREASNLGASAVNALDIDSYTTAEVDDAMLKGKIRQDFRHFDVIIAAFCFSEIRWNALNNLGVEDITHNSI